MNEISYLYPVKIALAEGEIETGNSLLKTKTMQIGLGENDVATVKGKSRIVLDFGKEVCGGVRVLMHYINDGEPVRIRFGESLSEALTPLGVKNATNDHSPRDFAVTFSQLSDGRYGNTGFRFVCFEFTGGEYRIKSILAACEEEKHAVIGSFSCSDPLVNEIYEVSRRTLFLCLHGGMIWDGIKRDRLVWIGDLHPETLGLLYTAGDIENIGNCLSFAAEETPPDGWMNGLSSYSFWWIVVLYDYYRFTGRKEVVEQHAEYLGKLIGNIDRSIVEDGSTVFPSDFLDWATSGTADAAEGVAALCGIACRRAAELLAVAGKDPSVAAKAAEKLGRRPQTELSAKQAIAMRYLACGENGRAVGAKLTEGGAKGVSSFMSYYILSAIGKTVGAEKAIGIMKEYYGGMLGKGATSFWEDFDVSWINGSGRIDTLPEKGEKDIHGDYGKYCYSGFRHSLCHGWSCGPIGFLAENVLGVSVKAAGCKKIEISPDLGGLSFAEGKVPTPFGTVEISHVKTDSGIKTKIIAPKETEIVTNGCIAEISKI